MRNRMGLRQRWRYDACMLTWDDLHTFLAIARHGSLSAAARALGVQQSTMSRRLVALEARAGARLVQRTPGGFALTPTGEAVFANVERIEAEALAVERTVSGRDVRLEGVVRVTAVETLAVEVLSPALASFQQRYPGITIELLLGTRSLSLARREADVALRMGRLPQADLVVRKLADIANALYANPGYLARFGAPDLADGGTGHRVILTHEDLLQTPEMTWLRAMAARAHVALRTNSRYAMRAATIAGIGFACLARYLGDPAVAAGRLVRLDAPDAPPQRELWMAVHRDTRHMPRVRAVTDHLSNAIRHAAPVLNPG